MTIKIVNKGLNDIKLMNVKLMESEDYNILSKSEEYVGSIDSDDYETIDFTITAKKDTDLVLDLEYMDANNVKYTEEQNIPLNLLSREDAQKLSNGGNGFVGVLIIIIIVGAGIFFYIRHKKKKKDKTKR